MAPINETHSGVAGVTPHGQPRTLHGTADDGRRATARTKTATPPGSRPVRSATRGEAESSKQQTKNSPPGERVYDTGLARAREATPDTGPWKRG